MAQSRIFIAACLSVIGFTAHGQSHTLEIGVSGGPSMISLRGNEAIEGSHQPSLGFAAGVSVQYNLTQHFSLHTDLAFERKGSEVKLTFVDINGSALGNTKVKTHLDQVTVPLLARYTVGSNVKFVLNAGPFVGFLVQATESAAGVSGFPGFSSETTDRFESLDYGLTGGVGVMVPFGAQLLLSMELRNNLGLANVSALPVVNDGSIQTNSAVLLVGCAYALNKRV